MLTEELMKKVRELEIAMRRSVSEVFSGEYSSAFRGRGMEFSEVREYQPGDDVRNIDWNVTARQGTPFIKRYVEERELTVVLAVDLSGSERFGSGNRTKSEAAAELCGVVALAATKNNDKVGLVIFTDTIEMYVPPAKGRKHVLRILRELLEFTPRARSGTDIGGALEHLGRVLKRRSIVFLVSDFLVPEGAWVRASGAGVGGTGLETQLRLMSRRHDIIAARMIDEREHRMPLSGAGLVEVEDVETGRRLVIDTGSTRARREFEALMSRRRKSLRDRLRRVGVDEIEVSPTEPYVHTLVELFRRREKRR
ncbi:MAG: DUF58 domain-containing protein [Phycisphaerae bacterium]|nr:DUF58 domain-containing protein [Phycisphaerae bacterium]